MKHGEGGVRIPPAPPTPPPGLGRGADLDGDDVPRLTEAHLPDLPAGAAADLAQVLQVVDFGLVALWEKKGGGVCVCGGGSEGCGDRPPHSVVPRGVFKVRRDGREHPAHHC